MARKLQIKRGKKANLPTLSVAELAMTTDSGAEQVFIGNGEKNIEVLTEKSLDVADVEAHISDVMQHVSTVERIAWNKKSDFSGSYNDLTNKPTAADIGAVPLDSSGRIHLGEGYDQHVFVDSEGISAFVDNNEVYSSLNAWGVHFYDGTAAVYASGWDDWNSEDSLQNGVAHMFFYDEDGNDIRLRGIANPATERDAANKAYVDEQDKSILNSAEAYADGIKSELLNNSSAAIDSIFELADAMSKNAGAIEALEIIAGNKASASDLTSHTGNTTVHVTSAEKEAWNKKSNFSGSYNDLTNKPTIPTVDSSLSSTSTNPVQNKVVNSALAGKYSTSGGNISGHVYLTGAKESSSTGNTSQIVFGTSDNNHVALSSNANALVINPTTTTTTNQIVLYLDKASQFPSGLIGNLTGTASNASKVANSMTIKLNGGTTEGTNLFTFNGSAAKTVNITPSAIGLATVATTGSYNDLSNKPTIPAAVTVDSALSSTSTNPVQNKVVTSALGGKLEKLSYEWNRSYNAGGTAGYLLIGSFPMYDSNLTIDIDATTNTTYHGTVVIATQNVSETSMGSACTITVYGDPTGAISDAIRVVWTSGSRNYNVYFVPSTWSKNLIHIRALGNYLEDTDTSKICTQFTAGTAPTTTSGLTVVNALKTSFAASSHNHAASTITGLATVATSGSYNDLTNKPTIPTLSSLGAVPTSRTVNGKALTNNISLTADDIDAIPNGGDGDYFLEGHLSFEASASDLLLSSDGIKTVAYEREGLEMPVHRPAITVTTYDGDSIAIPFTTIAPGITHVGYDEYSDNTDVMAGRIEFRNEEGAVKIGITGDAQNIYDSDAESYVMGIADGEDNPIILRGVNWPLLANDAASKEYVDELVGDKALSSHKHSASDITSGTLPIARGGTGATTAAAALTALGAAASSHKHAVTDITTAGTLPVRVNANATAMATLANVTLRNSYIKSTDMTAGSTSLATGAICYVYE